MTLDAEKSVREDMREALRFYLQSSYRLALECSNDGSGPGQLYWEGYKASLKNVEMWIDSSEEE